MKNLITITSIGLTTLFVFIQFNCQNDTKNQPKEIIKPKYEYGILLDSLDVKKNTVKPDETFGQILHRNEMYYALSKILTKSEGIFDFEKHLLQDKVYSLISSRDTNERILYFVYEINQIEYIVVDLRDGVDVYSGKKEVITKKNIITGFITSSLSQSILEKRGTQRLVEDISEIYAWTIDFFKIQKGDSFKIYYENNYIDSCGSKKFIGVGKILAAEFTHKDQSFYSFYYKQPDKNYGEYFDEEGRTLRKAFLKAPLDFYRISSRFSLNRKHPVTGQWKGHFGTDYAAPKGTEIMTTANGIIETASYTKNNGYYVKVRHNSIYTTQYLHMSKIRKGIKKGVYVKQGETIGYVGSTGLATGPHVCYRFWKNGKQVDPYKEKLPPGDPIKDLYKQEYLVVKDSLTQILISEKE